MVYCSYSDQGERRHKITNSNSLCPLGASSLNKVYLVRAVSVQVSETQLKMAQVQKRNLAYILRHLGIIDFRCSCIQVLRHVSL